MPVAENLTSKKTSSSSFDLRQKIHQKKEKNVQNSEVINKRINSDINIAAINIFIFFPFSLFHFTLFSRRSSSLKKDQGVQGIETSVTWALGTCLSPQEPRSSMPTTSAQSQSTLPDKLQQSDDLGMSSKLVL